MYAIIREGGGKYYTVREQYEPAFGCLLAYRQDHLRVRADRARSCGLRQTDAQRAFPHADKGVRQGVFPLELAEYASLLLVLSELPDIVWQIVLVALL